MTKAGTVYVVCKNGGHIAFGSGSERENKQDYRTVERGWRKASFIQLFNGLKSSSGSSVSS